MYPVVLLLVAVATSTIQVYGYEYQPAFYLVDAEEPGEEYLMVAEPLVRHRRQLFGGRTSTPGGGFSQSVGYRSDPFSGSMSQSFNRNGFSTPISYSGSLGQTSAAGHGGSGTIKFTPGVGGSGSVRGQVGLFGTSDHQVNAWAQHSRNLDRNFNIVGKETNRAGLTYTNNNNGAGAFLSGTHTPGRPDTGSVGGNVPLWTGNGGKTRLEATGETSFGAGKPNHNVGLSFTHQLP